MTVGALDVLDVQVPFLDLKQVNAPFEQAARAGLDRVLASGWYLLGREGEAFEQAFARYCQVPHVAGVANGLDALHLALLALGIGPGDEVLVPSNTYVASWLAVSRCGATPVPVEPELATYNLDPELLRARISSRTRAIMPVHLYGQPADMDAIAAVAAAHGLALLDDCAQAHGARYRGRPVGALAPASAWSFYPGKNLGALGDAGAVSTTDAALDARVRVLRNYGSRIKYHNEVKGFNSRLDEVQAAFLTAKLEQLDAATDERRHIAAQLLDGLQGLPLVLPTVPDWAEPAWHLFVIRHEARDRLAAALGERGIGTLIHYPVPPHLQPAYAELGYGSGDFPIAEQIHRECLSLPLWPGMNQAQIEAVISAVRACA